MLHFQTLNNSPIGLYRSTSLLFHFALPQFFVPFHFLQLAGHRYREGAFLVVYVKLFLRHSVIINFGYFRGTVLNYHLSVSRCGKPTLEHLLLLSHDLVRCSGFLPPSCSTRFPTLLEFTGLLATGSESGFMFQLCLV